MAYGRGKVIIVGEHAVVYGHPALAAGIDRGVKATAESSNKHELILQPWDRVIEPNADDAEPLSRAFHEALAQFDTPPPLRVETKINLPAGAGLGCSAALGVAVIEAIADALNIETTRQELADRTLSWETIFHGNPSGIDNTMAAMGGLAIYTKDEGMASVKFTEPMKLVVANSGETSSTKEMVASVAKQFEREPRRMQDAFEAIAVIVTNAKLKAEQGDWEALGQLMDMNQALLSSFMLSTTKLEQMCDAARLAGAAGAKVTGAGGGGCMIAIVERKAIAPVVLEALQSHDPHAFVAEVTP